MTERLIELVHQINDLEKQIRQLSDEKRVLEEELKRFSVADDGVRDVRRKADE
jgi:prefoldin subunit 5